MELFSDAVLAIAITLLVLDLKVPADARLTHALGQLWPQLLAYLMSFLMIGA